MIDYHPLSQNGIIVMQAKVECIHGKFKKYYDNKIMYDELYFDIVLLCNIVIYFPKLTI